MVRWSFIPHQLTNLGTYLPGEFEAELTDLLYSKLGFSCPAAGYLHAVSPFLQ